MCKPASLLPALCGYALLFDVPTIRRADGRRLVFDSEAFDRSLVLRRQGVYATLDHQGAETMIASNDRGTLLIDSDIHGLWTIILPRNDREGRISAALVSGGHVAAMSASVVGTGVVGRGNIQHVRQARLREVSACKDPAIRGTSLHVAPHGVPQTIYDLLTEDCFLLEANMEHAKAGTLLNWKVRKAARRSRLLESLTLANAG